MLITEQQSVNVNVVLRLTAKVSNVAGGINVEFDTNKVKLNFEMV